MERERREESMGGRGERKVEDDDTERSIEVKKNKVRV